jgi:hypothetical protein
MRKLSVFCTLKTCKVFLVRPEVKAEENKEKK